MSIITKPTGGILKGVPATITLNKSLLQALPIVVADEYFSDPANWKRVLLNYKSVEGKQYEIVEFNATLSNPTGFFDVSLKARDSFEIQNIKILDFDGGIFVIPRSSLTIADFDIALGSGTGGGGTGGSGTGAATYYTYNMLGSGITTNSLGGIQTTTSSNEIAFYNVAFTGDFDIEFKFDGAVAANDSFFGVKSSLNDADNWFGFRFVNIVHTYFYGVQKDTVSNNSSNNTYRIKRVGSTIEFYANGVKTPNSASSSAALYLAVRANAGFVLNSTSAYAETFGADDVVYSP